MKKNINGYIPLLLGILILLVFFSNGSTAREAPVFDDDVTQDFRLTLEGFDSSPDAGTTTDIEISVENRGEDGTMFVQCSILNKEEEGEFLVGREDSVEFLDNEDNCKTDEPFTQTATVELANDNSTEITYTVEVPQDEDGDYAYYCSAFERCWVDENTDIGETSYLSRDVTIVFDSEAALNATGGTTGVFGDGVVFDWDFDGSNDAVRSWFSEHSLIVLLVGFGLLILGALLVYS